MNPEPTIEHTPETVEPESIANGPVLLLLVALLLSVLGGMYYWFAVLNQEIPDTKPSLRPTAAQNNEPESTTAEAQVETMGAVSTSDEIPAIEADFESTQLQTLDAELDAIETELEAALQTGTVTP